MKATVADYRYRVLCCRIVPVSGATIRLTDYPRDLTMSNGQVYLSTSGYEFTGYSAGDAFAPASIDLEGIAGAAGISRAALGSGLFDGARVYGFATAWTSPVEDQEPISAGLFGATTLRDDRYQIDGLSLVDVLGQTVGQTFTAQCPKVFLSQTYGGCMVPVAANTVTGTLTGVVSASRFQDTARGEADDVFAAGTIKFTSGANVGQKALEVKIYLANGTIEVFESFYYLPVAGDAYTMTRGCRKRMSDCQWRWNGTANFSNILNFGGFPYIPAGSVYAQAGTNG
jgi:uncharacterized phage protein (TIGR02218 family)